MKKILISAAAMMLALSAFILEGGSIRTLLIVTALVPILAGPLVTALFSFQWSEITGAFRDAFAERAERGRADDYRMGLLVVKDLSAGAMYWAFTILVLAMIGILSSVTEVRLLGPKIALGTVSVLIGLGLRAFLLNPMASSLEKKLIQIGPQTAAASSGGKLLN